MRKIALVACSNGLEVRKKGSVEELCAYLEGLGFTPCVSPCLYEKDPVFCSVFSGTAEERAEALMSFYRDPEVQAILDLSGGDLANELLPYLDYEVIGKSQAEFWGYSDLTTILNAIYAKTGRSSVLYQARNLVSDGGLFRRPAFENTILQKQSDLFQISCQDGYVLQPAKAAWRIPADKSPPSRHLYGDGGQRLFPDHRGAGLPLRRSRASDSENPADWPRKRRAGRPCRRKVRYVDRNSSSMKNHKAAVSIRIMKLIRKKRFKFILKIMYTLFGPLFF